MNKTQRTLNRYFRQIRKALPCSKDAKTDILADIQEAVKCYQLDHPDAAFADIQSRFGTPKEIAAACAEESSAEALMSDFQNQRKPFRLTIRVAAAVFAATLVFILATGCFQRWTNPYAGRIIYVVNEQS